jgi:hypothetical protein
LMTLLGNTRSSRLLNRYTAKCSLYDISATRFSTSAIKM